MSLHVCWIPLDHATEGTQEVTPDLSLPVSQTGVQDNSDLNTSGSPRGLLLKGNLATLFLSMLPAVPKSWEGSGRPQLIVSKVYKTQVGKRRQYQDKSSKSYLAYLPCLFPPISPRPLNPHPCRPLCWCGRKAPCESRRAPILQPRVTHFPKELRECRAGGARALEQIVGFNRQIGHCYGVCCLEFPPLYYN